MITISCANDTHRGRFGRFRWPAWGHVPLVSCQRGDGRENLSDVIEIESFNQLAQDAAGELLSGCCSSDRWVTAVTAGRPYASVAAICDRSDAAVAVLAEPDLQAALAGHPRIGDRPAPASMSSQEQAGVSGADESVRQQLAAGNVAYEQRFGHIYLACATGRSATELLGFLRERLGNDRAAEWRVVAAELAKINQIRLRKLIGAAANQEKQ